MDFSEALTHLKAGHRVARAGWDGWLVLIPSGHGSPAVHVSDAGIFQMQPCIGMKTATNEMQPGWLASQADLLALDWKLVS